MPEPHRTALPASLRRARAQWPLLVTVTLVLVVSGTLAAVCALLATAGLSDALAARWQAAQPRTVVATSLVMADEAPAQGATALATARDLVTEAAGDLAGPASTWAASPLLYLPGSNPRATYLLDADTAAEHAHLQDGRWPQHEPASGSGSATQAGAVTEVVLLRPTADALGVGVGDELVLAQHAGPDPDGGVGARTATIVGIATRDTDDQWGRDQLGGAGTGTVLGRIDAFGPLLVAPGTLLEAGEPVARGSVRVVPDLAREVGNATATVARLGALRSNIQAVLGEDVRTVTVHSGVGDEVHAGLAEQSMTRSLVLAVLLVVVALAVTVLTQLGRALAARRRAEWELARLRGAARWQVTRGTVGEALVAAVVAAGCATAVGTAGYRATLGAAAGGGADAVANGQVSELTSAGSAVVPPAVLAAVAFATVVPAAVVAMEAWRATGGRSSRPVLRSAAEVLLVVIAAIGAVQLRAHPPSPGIDPLLVLAPGAIVAALVVVALRVVPLAARAADGAVARLRGAVLPLAVWPISRGTRTGALAALVWSAAVLAFVAPLAATWSQSRVDQAAAAAGADLVVPDAAGGDTGAVVAEASGAQPVPVISRAVQLGSRPGAARLVAIDAERAEEVVLGPLDGRDDADRWAQVMAPLVRTTAPGPELGDELALTISGEADGIEGYLLEVTPTLIAEAPSGERIPVAGEPVFLDGEVQQSALPADLALPPGSTLAAVQLAFDLLLASTDTPFLSAEASASVTVALAGAPVAGEWTASFRGTDQGVAAQVRDGALVTSLGAEVMLVPATPLLLSSFPLEPEVPVLASATLAADLGLTPGDLLDLRLGAAAIPARVVDVIPYVPSQPGAPALLADRTTIANAALHARESGAMVDAWWMAQPRDDAAARLAQAGLEPLTPQGSQAGQAALGPLSRPVLTALVLLAGGAVALCWAAVGAEASATARSQAILGARLRAMGGRRADVRRIRVVRIVVTTVVAVVAGALAGTAAAHLIAPWVVVGSGGTRPIPQVVMVTPLAMPLLALAILAASAIVVAVGLGGRAGSLGPRHSPAGLLRAGDAA